MGTAFVLAKAGEFGAIDGEITVSFEEKAGLVPRFYFFSNEGGEPVHIHVQRDRMLAKFWLRPVSLASSTGFPAQELRRIEQVVVSNRAASEEAWRAFFRSEG